MEVVPNGSITPVMETTEDGRTRPVRFTLGEAGETYRRQSLRQYRQEVESAQAEAEAEAARPQPPTGSPASMASELEGANRESRESAMESVSNAAASAWDSITESMAQAREKDGPAVGPMGRPGR